MMRISIIGHFMYGTDFCNGQAIKTRNVYNALAERYPDAQISTVDTNCFSRKFPGSVLKFVQGVLDADAIIFMPTKRLLTPLSRLLSLCEGGRKKKAYVVVGGWLPAYCAESRRALDAVHTFDRVLVETKRMQRELLSQGVKRVSLLPNFSLRNAVPMSLALRQTHVPLRLCTFSRVIEEKGILEALEAVREAQNAGISCMLDIYGPIAPDFYARLVEAIGGDRTICYRGALEANDISNTLASYDCMLFPTFYEGEGFPGSLIDAFGSALPVIASDWHDNAEIIADGSTGFIVPVHDANAMADKIAWFAHNKREACDMRVACLKERAAYYPDRALLPLFNFLESGEVAEDAQ